MIPNGNSDLHKRMMSMESVKYMGKYVFFCIKKSFKNMIDTIKMGKRLNKHF